MATTQAKRRVRVTKRPEVLGMLHRVQEVMPDAQIVEHLELRSADGLQTLINSGGRITDKRYNRLAELEAQVLPDLTAKRQAQKDREKEERNDAIHRRLQERFSKENKVTTEAIENVEASHTNGSTNEPAQPQEKRRKRKEDDRIPMGRRLEDHEQRDLLRILDELKGVDPRLGQREAQAKIMQYSSASSVSTMLRNKKSNATLRALTSARRFQFALTNFGDDAVTALLDEGIPVLDVSDVLKARRKAEAPPVPEAPPRVGPTDDAEHDVWQAWFEDTIDTLKNIHESFKVLSAAPQVRGYLRLISSRAIPASQMLLGELGETETDTPAPTEPVAQEAPTTE